MAAMCMSTIAKPPTSTAISNAASPMAADAGSTTRNTARAWPIATMPRARNTAAAAARTDAAAFGAGTRPPDATTDSRAWAAAAMPSGKTSIVRTRACKEGAALRAAADGAQEASAAAEAVAGDVKRDGRLVVSHIRVQGWKNATLTGTRRSTRRGLPCRLPMLCAQFASSAPSFVPSSCSARVRG
ncbi:hypothetical protein PSAC2689_10728 [Paraburkholderia sacchari]